MQMQQFANAANNLVFLQKLRVSEGKLAERWAYKQLLGIFTLPWQEPANSDPRLAVLKVLMTLQVYRS